MSRCGSLSDVVDARKIAAALNSETLPTRHVAKYRAQFDTCRLDLPDTQPGLTTPARLQSFRDTRNPHLAALYFAFGRYLLISSSQPGTQPPTLQGIWNEWRVPPWMSSYTININLEMNYWPVDVANLSPLAEPLLAALEEMTVSACRAGGVSCAAGAFAGWPLGSASGVDGRPGRPGGQAPPHLPPLRPLSVGYDVERRKLKGKDGSLDFTFHDSPAPTSTSIVV